MENKTEAVLNASEAGSNVIARFLLDPLRGLTPLWRICWLYSMVGGGVLNIAGKLTAETGEPTQIAFHLLGLLYSCYVVLAAYRCAGNSRWPFLAPLIRASVIVSLLLVPYFAYLIVS